MAIESIPRFEVLSSEELSTTKEKWTEGVTINVSDSLYPDNNISAEAKIRPRGLSSYHYGRDYGAMPYKIKFTEKQDLFGWGADKNYILVPNLVDPSALRDYVAYKMGTIIMGESWTQEIKLVELYVNGAYKGLYNFVESIEASEARANLDRFYDPASKTTPFIVEYRMRGGTADFADLYTGRKTRLDEAFAIDLTVPVPDERRYDSVSKAKMTFELHYPDDFSEVSDEQGDFIVSTMNNIFTKIKTGKPLDGAAVSVESFARYYLVMEMLKNYDFYASMYYTFDGTTLSAGPIWDYDHSLSDFSTRHWLYEFSGETERDTLYDALFEYDEFEREIHRQFTSFYENFAGAFKKSLENLRDNKLVAEAWQRNENLYHRLSDKVLLYDMYSPEQINLEMEKRKTYEEQVDYIIGFLFNGLSENGDNTETDQPGRIEWMRENLASWRAAHDSIDRL